MGQLRWWLVIALTLIAVHPLDLFVNGDVGPSESECRPYIEKALHQYKGDEAKEETVLDVDLTLDDEKEVDEGSPPVDVESEETTRIDTDGDGIPNEEDDDIDGDVIPNEEDEDIDGDGILNVEDSDLDGDGVSNVNDSDLDGDGVPNIQDNDLDGDGIPNDQDDDIDGDGIPNDQDDDIDGDGVGNSDDNDIDGDGIPNDQDNDIDGDGIPNDKDEDIDGDGVLNVDDSDMDGDGVPNDQDGDIDGDGLLNEDDNDIDGDGIANEDDNDIDGDGIPNYKDNDIDGDGIPNDEDSDVDGDGIPNEEDHDIDGDGLPNEEEPRSSDIDGDGILNDDDVDIDGDVVLNEWDEDMDGDGIPNTDDRDIDGDGIPNVHDDDKHEPLAVQPGAKPLEEELEKVVEAVFEATLEEPGFTKDAEEVEAEDTQEAEQPTEEETQAAKEAEEVEKEEEGEEEEEEEEAISKRHKRSLEAEEVKEESESDTDGDGIPDHEDDDMDGDGIPNHLDSDIDGDGILNEDELEHEALPKLDKETEEEVTEEVAASEAEEEEPAVEEEQEEGEGTVAEDAEAGDEEEGTEEEASEAETEDTKPEDELLWEGSIPEVRRSRDHINELLQLDEDSSSREKAVNNIAQIILRDIKRIYENAIKPLETLYKYRDLSNRHFSDPEIFSKPLILFMGPWSGGKSTIINYLTDNEYTQHSLRSGAEPSPAYFNILMWGNETEILDGTQLAADYTFSGLQKFGQGLEDRLRGLKMPNKLLEKVNIVEIPGILEVRREVSRMFPFNDACQWFIDRADIICLVYDPAKLDVGPETEAILDQLKGREHQTRIILNKADTVKPEELLRVQSALIWNISPLMSSAQPPLIYTTSLWSHPYQEGSPARLLLAQERAILRDLRTAVDKRIENRIASARRFAVRVRNHAKMVDCYLNTYYNHKTLFSNKKRVAEDIINSPQNYHIYEGLSTLTNISRYDLPDPEVYRDFFHLNPLYEFKKLSETCSYFGGCPITKLDVAIAYDLPDLVGKYKKMAENALSKLDSKEDLR